MYMCHRTGGHVQTRGLFPRGQAYMYMYMYDKAGNWPGPLMKLCIAVVTVCMDEIKGLSQFRSGFCDLCFPEIAD